MHQIKTRHVTYPTWSNATLLAWHCPPQISNFHRLFKPHPPTTHFTSYPPFPLSYISLCHLMEKAPDSPTHEEALVNKIQELFTDESDSEMAQFCFEEETIEEVMQQFYNELAGSHKPPSSPPPHATDAGSNGSCGASVSDSNSTVMAGIQLVGPACNSPPKAKVTMETSSEVESDELDDEWLGKVLSWEHGQPVENKLWF